MAQRVIWSLEAAEDLEAIAEYIERDSPHYAAAVVEKITTLTRSLPAHPRMGRKVMGIGVRSRVVAPRAGRDATIFKVSCDASVR